MSSPEIESPFEEKKSKLLVWIVPSVALHLIILLVWLLLPEGAPRAPVERKMTINSSQALRLQQHVEDANLLQLQAQVSELQAIKSAMAEIRDRKMAQLRTFEEQMVVAAPQDATELFTRLLDTQASLMAAYQQMYESARLSIELKPKVLELLQAEQIAAALPGLIEAKSLWDDAKAQLSTVRDDTANLFALINTAEITFEWMSDPGIKTQLADLQTALELAQQANSLVGSSLYKSFSSQPARYLDELIVKNEAYAAIIDGFAQANIDGKLAVEAKRAEQLQRIEEAEAAIEKMTQQQTEIRQQIEGLAKDDKATLGNLNWQAKKTRTELINLGKRVGQAKATLKKIRDFRPNNNTQKKINYINKVARSVFVADPDLELITQAIQAQAVFAQSAQALLAVLVEQTSAEGGLLR
jgi:hypothetical protein